MRTQFWGGHSIFGSSVEGFRSFVAFRQLDVSLRTCVHHVLLISRSEDMQKELELKLEINSATKESVPRSFLFTLSSLILGTAGNLRRSRRASPSIRASSTQSAPSRWYGSLSRASSPHLNRFRCAMKPPLSETHCAIELLRLTLRSLWSTIPI